MTDYTMWYRKYVPERWLDVQGLIVIGIFDMGKYRLQGDILCWDGVGNCSFGILGHCWGTLSSSVLGLNTLYILYTYR